jgi:hypothetical protein
MKRSRLVRVKSVLMSTLRPGCPLHLSSRSPKRKVAARKAAKLAAPEKARD